MDIPRYALIAASVLLGLMLLGEWSRFSTAQQEAALPAVPMVEAETAAPDTLTRWRWWAPHLKTTWIFLPSKISTLPAAKCRPRQPCHHRDWSYCDGAYRRAGNQNRP